MFDAAALLAAFRNRSTTQRALPAMGNFRAAATPGADRADVEAAWADGVRRGDPAALEAMYAAYGVRLCAYAYHWTGSHQIAEEIVQDIFLAIWRKGEEWEFSGVLKAYLFRATRNRIINHLDHRRIEERFGEWAACERFDGASSRPEPTPDEYVRRKELQQSVHDAIAELSDRCREIFLLNREQGLTYNEIAQLLGVTVKTVEYHMGRAFRHFRLRLAEWSPDESARAG